MARCRSLGLSLALLLVSTLISLLILEFAVRWLLPQYAATGDIEYTVVDGVPLAPANTETIQWKNTGDYRVKVSINRLGLRDVKDLSQATAADLFVVGDSFALGHGVEENERFSNRLEGLLGQRVFNVAIPTDIAGYETLIDYAERQGAKVQKVVLAVCMENDIGQYRDRITPVTRLRERRNFAEALRRSKMWLQRNSSAYRALGHQAHASQALQSLFVRLGFITPAADGALRNVYSQAAIDQSAERVAAIAAKHQVIIVIIPSRLRWVGNNIEQERRLHAGFVEKLRALGLPVIDLAPAFEKGNHPMDYHFPNDGHWTAAGHGLAAAEIADYIRKQGWPAIMPAKP